MRIDADAHNFGQQVTHLRRGSEIYFQKPRPVFWEWFFFGVDSPLKSALDGPTTATPPIQDGIFNLNVEMGEKFSGISKGIIEVDTSEIDQKSHAYQLGGLIAYCYLFGIRDLHKGNVIRTKNHLQVIDAEVIFSKILLPNETLLLPFKETTFEICGARKSFANPEVLSTESICDILRGYFDLFLTVINSHESVTEVFSSYKDQMLKIPIRHIMRDTAHYRKWRENKIMPSVVFCDDELLQLERGDVPYYFKFLDDPRLYSYTSSDGDYTPITAPEAFLKGVERDAFNPLELLSIDRIQRELLPTGSLFILKKLSPVGFTGKLEAHNFKASVTPENLEINFSEKTFTAKAK